MLFESIGEFKRELEKHCGKAIGLVPTMGYLHEGHQSLIQRAAHENDVVVVSVFVNPTQFGPNEDYARYPRDMQRDLAMVTEAGGHIVFHPAAEEIYPPGYKTYVDVGGLSAGLCGASRPGHFRGVATVVLNLFNIVRPKRAYFGQKDAQQLLVITRMVRDLKLDIEVVGCHIVREPDGLAMSSRNVYLDACHREQAAALYRALRTAKERVLWGERDAAALKAAIIEEIKAQPLAEIDYVAVVDARELCEMKVLSGRILIALAVKFGGTRLIDNIMIEL